MAVARLVPDVQPLAEHQRGDLRPQLLEGVLRASRDWSLRGRGGSSRDGMRRAVGQLVQQRVLVGRRHGELGRFGHRDGVGARGVAGAVPAHVDDADVRVAGDPADGGVRLEGRGLDRRVVEVEAVGLGDVEDVVDGGEEQGPVFLVVRVFGAGRGCAGALAPDEDRRALLALADHAAGAADLAEAGPAHVAVSAGQGGGEQEDRVVAAVAAAGGGVGGPAELAGLPGFLPRGDAGLERLDEAVGERAGVLFESCVHVRGILVCADGRGGRWVLRWFAWPARPALRP